MVIGPFLGLFVSLSNAVHQTKSIFIRFLIASPENELSLIKTAST